MLHISVYSRNSLLKEYSFEGERIITIGRASTNDVVLPDSSKKVSRHHAALVLVGDSPQSIFIRDLGSRHAVRIRESAVARAWLQSGDTIEVADYKIRCQSEGRNTPNDHLRIVPKKRPCSNTDETTLDFSTLTGLGKLDFDDSQRELVSQIRQLEKTLPDARAYADAVMPALCRLIRADRGFIRRFSVETTPIPDIGIVGLRRQDAIEVSDDHYLDQIKAGCIVVEPDTLLSPIIFAGSVSGMICVDRSSGSEDFTDTEIRFLQLVGTIIGKRMGLIDSATEAGVAEKEFVWPEGSIGKSKVFKQLIHQVRDAALSKEAVLILGETGTGKELVARGIHNESKRPGRFIDRNMAQVTESLAESMIFGYAPKAGIAGADPAGSPGWFELADQGTLFLDEIQQMTVALQDKFLRILEVKEVWRIQSKNPKSVDVKVIAATDADIEKAKLDGRLSKAFFFRFQKSIVVPPLRERKDDIPLLSYYFLDMLDSGDNGVARLISHRAMECLLRYDWPGNIRELRFCIANSLRPGADVIFSWNLPEHIQRPATLLGDPTASGNQSSPRTLEEMERGKILETLEAMHGNKKQSADRLGISRMTLLNKMDKFGIPRSYGTDEADKSNGGDGS